MVFKSLVFVIHVYSYLVIVISASCVYATESVSWTCSFWGTVLLW